VEGVFDAVTRVAASVCFENREPFAANTCRSGKEETPSTGLRWEVLSTRTRGQPKEKSRYAIAAFVLFDVERLGDPFDNFLDVEHRELRRAIIAFGIR
jgi:hypothetical protein